MTVANAKEILFKAAEGKYAVGAFNVTHLIQMQAIVAAAVNRKAPLITQTSFPKFNVSTDLKMTLIDTTFNYISEHREEYNPGRIDMAIRKAVVEKIEHWIDLLGSAGKA